ncbi:MAG: molybdopterin molybdotransferase MoeA [Planctomycetes bacterium]|nr:molybdopterin molybdotransferase MoeA [Planctomycetota bacterium]
MIELQEALDLVARATPPPAPHETVPLDQALGRILASEAISDVDLPPFPKSAMDGYAVRVADVRDVPCTLDVVGESRAGMAFSGVLAPGQAVHTMTGAPVPEGADGLVIVEHTEVPSPGRVRLLERPAAGRHLVARATELSRGTRVLEAGCRLRATEIGVLASVGKANVEVRRSVRVTCMTTGDEVVPADRVPGPWEIRDSNTPALVASLRGADRSLRHFERAIDDPEDLGRRIHDALAACDVLVMTGGVSMGKYDLVGEALTAAGFEQVFHKVSIKPGKPVWFGVRDVASCVSPFGRQLAFGLPGNPVSAFLGGQLFVEPTLRRLVGDPEPGPRFRTVELLPGFAVRANARRQFLPAALTWNNEGRMGARLIRWTSSADHVSLSRADGFVMVEPHAIAEPGAQVPFLAFPA